MGKIVPTQGFGGGMDKRGVATVTVPFWCEDLADVFTVGIEPPASGLISQGRTFRTSEAGGYDVSVGWEGLPTEWKPNALPVDDPQNFSFDSSFGEEPLPSHPEWKAIKEIYKGTVDEDKKVSFEEFIKNGEGGGLGASKGDDGKTKNPLFGVTTYLALKAVFRWTYTVEELPANFLSRIAEIRKNLPGGLPTPAEHDWLVMPPKANRRGNVYEVTEEWMLSGKGGWPKNVYKLIET